MKKSYYTLFFFSAVIICTFFSISCAKKAQKPLSLDLWYSLSGAAGEAVKEQVAAYCAENPAVTVNLSYSGSYIDTAAKISLSLSAQKAPDIALMAGGPLYTGGRGDFRLDALVKNSASKDTIYDVFWQYASYNEKICAVPYGMSVPVVYYNRELLRTLGLPEPDKSAIYWDDFITLLSAAKKNLNARAENRAQKISAFDSYDPVWLLKTLFNQKMHNTAAAQTLSANFEYDGEKGSQVLKMWKNLIDLKLMSANLHELAEKNFLAGNVLFLVTTSNRILRWGTENILDFGIMQLPHFGSPSVNIGGNMLVIFSTNESQFTAAWNLVSFLTSAENQKVFAEKTGYLPVSKNSLLAGDTTIIRAFNETALFAAENGFVYNWQFQTMGVLESVIKSAVEKLEHGLITPEEASAEIGLYHRKQH